MPHSPQASGAPRGTRFFLCVRSPKQEKNADADLARHRPFSGISRAALLDSSAGSGPP
jgi:hypothetical protein